mmetsp:Transcript_105983/g.252896  ORF Transcript_105983/g.252896 Transcript_105983/m.252896 type:complete len:658 (+) Transcript_105983:55-2028(+)
MTAMESPFQVLDKISSLNQAQERAIALLRIQLQTGLGAEEQEVSDDGAVPSERWEALPKTSQTLEVAEDEAFERPGPPDRALSTSRTKALCNIDLANLALREVWKTAFQRPTFVVEELKEETARVVHHSSLKKAAQEASGERKPCALILSPNDHLRVAWDLTGMLLLFYDIIAIPLTAFDPDPETFTQVMDWTTQIFWTWDIVMSLITGYVSEGEIVFRPWLICLNYLKTWFILDMAVCGPDWVSTFVELSSVDVTTDPGGVNRLLRSLRVVRTVRLLRLVKLKRILAMIKDRITSEAVFILVNICKLIVMLLLVNHFIAAAWYLLGTMGDPINNWLDVYDMRKDSANLGYRYSTSLHWSLTQFTPASMDVHPQNLAERSFAILVLIAGLVLFSSFISSITGSMSQLRNMKADKSKQFWLLRRYLKQQNVPRDLCFRVLRYIEYATANVHERVPEGRITILKNLTEQLRNELTFFTYYRCLKAHALFKQIDTMNQAILISMSSQVLRSLDLAAGDPLFSVVDVPYEMFWIQKGVIRYVLQDLTNGRRRSLSRFTTFTTATQDTENTVILGQGEYLCEVALWSPWAHVGNAQAVAEANLVCIDQALFCEVALKDVDLGQIVTLYARRFLEFMSEEGSPWIEISNQEAKDFSQSFFSAD